MNEKLSLKQIIPVGLMLFSFFFGAGNLIFPPILGQMAGTNSVPALIGFCLSGVGLPLLGVLCMAIKRSENPADMTYAMPRWYSLAVVVLIALTIGPLGAIPRTAAVSFETGFGPLLGGEIGDMALTVYSVLFFGMSYYFSVNPSRVLTAIGKVMSPALLVCLVILIACVIMIPLGDVQLPNSTYVTAPLFKGFQQGYNTMDLLCAFLFGAVTVQTIQLQGIKEPKLLTKICIFAGIMAAACLAVIYGALGYTGATSVQAFGIMANGAQLLNRVAQYYMGLTGQIVLALIIFFACMTTSIGLTTSISANFEKIVGGRIKYERWTVYISLVGLCIANMGLDKVIQLTLPIIFALYPVVIAIVLLTLGEQLWGERPVVMQCCLALTTAFSLLDGLRVAGVNMTAVDAVLRTTLPLFDIGFGWVAPCAVGMIVGLVISLLKK